MTKILALCGSSRRDSFNQKLLDRAILGGPAAGAALLKNTFGWMSRPPGFPSRKVAALLSASPGLLGGVKSQLSLQIVLGKMGVLVIPDSFALGAAHQAFDAEGGLKDANVAKAVRCVGMALTATAAEIGTSDRAGLAA